MKKIIHTFFIVLISLLTVSCASLNSLSDYDSETFQRKHLDNEAVVLGTVKVSRISFLFSKYDSGETRAKKLLNQLEKKAIKKYGNYIDIVDIEVGKFNTGASLGLWGVAYAESILAAIPLGMAAEKNPDEIDESLIFIPLLPLALCCFKFNEATATVVTSPVPYSSKNKILISDSFIINNRKSYEENAKQQKENEIIQERENKKIQLQDEINSYEQELNELKKSKELKEKEYFDFLSKENIPIFIEEIDIKEISDKYKGCKIKFTNISNKLISNIKFLVVPYNDNGKQSFSQSTGISDTILEKQIYISPSESYTIDSSILWDNPNIKNIKLSSVEIQFNDNSIISIKDVNKLFSEDIRKINIDIMVLEILIESDKKEYRRLEK